MTDYFTRDYQKGIEIKQVLSKIERSAIGEKDYIDRYGKDSLHLNGYKLNSLIMQLIFDGSRTLVHFDNKKTVSKILKDSRVKKASGLENSKVIALSQKEKVVGIRKN